LHGADFELLENLRTFCDQAGGSDQIVFGLRTADDPAATAVARLMAARPGHDLALVIDPWVGGSNRKICNLENMLPAAAHEILVISDSDMRVGADYLQEVTAPLADPGVGLVTCLYRGRSAGGLWSDLGALHINHGFLPAALIGWHLQPGSACFGATMALRRTTLEESGGFAALRDLLADDYVLGASVRRLGLKVVLAAPLVDTMVAEPDFTTLMRHELRWARTIRSLAPMGYAASVIGHATVLAALAAILSGFALTMDGVFGIALLGRLIAGRLIDRALGLPTTPVLLDLLRDALSFMIFVASFFGSRVEWRGASFRLAADGTMATNKDLRA
jgi:ceramide glucosyltransferase